MLPHANARLLVGAAARDEERGQLNVRRHLREASENQLHVLLQLVLGQRAVTHSTLHEFKVNELRLNKPIKSNCEEGITSEV